MKEPRRTPRKKSGHAAGPRRINGAALGVREAAAFLGVTEKSIRGRVARRRVPYRRDGGRILFLRAELEAWLDALPGVTLTELKRDGGGA